MRRRSRRVRGDISRASHLSGLEDGGIRGDGGAGSRGSRGKNAAGGAGIVRADLTLRFSSDVAVHAEIHGVGAIDVFLALGVVGKERYGKESTTIAASDDPALHGHITRSDEGSIGSRSDRSGGRRGSGPSGGGSGSRGGNGGNSGSNRSLRRNRSFRRNRRLRRTVNQGIKTKQVKFHP